MKMINMRKPVESVQDVLEDCVSNIRNRNLQDRFRKCKLYIDSCTVKYDQNACSHTIHTINEHDNVNGIVSKDEMVRLYDEKFSKKNQPGRKYYDKLMHSAPDGICPICGVQIASTLDHYLAKTKYPVFAVSPINLIPTCRDCNTLKKDKSFQKSEDEFLHPYYDDIDQQIWLVANIVEQSDIAVTFNVIKPIEWDNVLYERVVNYFKTFELNHLYSIYAASEICSIRKKLERLKNTAGIEAVKFDLQETSISCHQVRMNSWKSALYRELSINNWFCNDYLD